MSAQLVYIITQIITQILIGAIIGAGLFLLIWSLFLKIVSTDMFDEALAEESAIFGAIFTIIGLLLCIIIRWF